MPYQEAVYHLGYEVDDDQPVINVHTDPAHLDEMLGLEEDLADVQAYLRLTSGFTFDQAAYGYEGVGRIEESERASGWVALKLAIPKAEEPERYLGSPTPRILPLVTTLSMTLGYLNQLVVPTEGNPDNPQLITASLSNSVPLNESYSAPLSARLTAAMLERLASLADVDAAEERVRQALKRSFEYPYGLDRDDRFWVDLRKNVSFDYPGDGTGFFASLDRREKGGGIKLNAANNDYPLQQIAILGGLAALNDVALEQVTR